MENTHNRVHNVFTPENDTFQFFVAKLSSNYFTAQKPYAVMPLAGGLGGSEFGVSVNPAPQVIYNPITAMGFLAMFTY